MELDYCVPVTLKSEAKNPSCLKESLVRLDFMVRCEAKVCHSL